MSRDRWERIQEVFHRAADLPEPERAALLRDVSAQDPALAAEVEALLEVDAKPDQPLDRLAGSAVAGLIAETESAHPGTMVGPYRIVREVARGGMGAVYEATRADGRYARRVAIKMVRAAALDSEQTVARFHQERQILAALEHPNIATLFDGGVTEDGRPYFVMEFVEGEAITDWCSAQGLDVQARLRLFRDVCAAVQYAHRHLVVHRDLKPRNILVTADGTVKLVDFGIAKLLLEEGPEAATAMTRTGVLPLTPEYASPEQVRGEKITTASDVYSLGVVLFELLTGGLPYSLDTGSWPAVVRAVSETQPRKPSSVHEPGGALEMDTRLRGLPAGELDNIVLMALRKEPDRRYESVERFSEDILNFLEGRPVLAQPDSVGYRLRKWTRRNRGVAAAAALLVISLLAGITATSWQAEVARAERDRSRRQAERAEQLADYVTGMLAAADPRVDSRSVTVREVLTAAAERAERELADQPDLRASVQATIGRSLLSLGLYAEAEPVLRASVETRRALEAAPAALSASLNDYAIVQESLGDVDAADRLLEEAFIALQAAGDTAGVEMANTLVNLGHIRQTRGEYEEAERIDRQALALRRALFGDRHEEVAIVLNNLGVVLGNQGRWDEAEPLHREAIDIMRATRGSEHPDLGSAIGTLAFVIEMRGDYPAADSLYREALAIRTASLGEGHPDALWTAQNLASMRLYTGDYHGAIQIAREVLSWRGRTLPDEHIMTSSTLHVLGRSLAALGRHREAEPALRESLELRRSTLPEGHWLVASSASALGECLAASGQSAEAEELLMAGYEGLARARGDANDRTIEALNALISFYQKAGRNADAERWRARLPATTTEG